MDVKSYQKSVRNYWSTQIFENFAMDSGKEGLIEDILKEGAGEEYEGLEGYIEDKVIEAIEKKNKLSLDFLASPYEIHM